MRNWIYLFLAVIFVSGGLHKAAAQQADVVTDSSAVDTTHDYKLKHLIVPAVLFSYGIVALESESLKTLNSDTRDELKQHIDEKVSIDDFTQYSPLAAVFVLPNLGVKPEHDLGERSIIAGTSFLIMASTVTILKNVSNVERPDGSSDNSFPSGHTATAFMGAEMVYQEFKDESIWYGVSAYTVAAGTGFFRMYNNRHWLSDVAMGAGIGILSTKLSYWLFPEISKLFNKSESRVLNNMEISPYADQQQQAIRVLYRF